MNSYYNLSSEEVFQLLDSRETGLTDKEAQVRLAKVGPNVLPEKKPTPIYVKILSQFKDFLILLLLFAALVSFALGESIDGAAIIVIVVVNALISFIQEFKAERALEALKKQEKEMAKVYRDGNLKTVDTAELVPGDVVLVESGDSIPADSRIFKAFGLKVNESLLTGESLPADKGDQVLSPGVVLAEQSNMLFKGTSVMEGKAWAVVTGTALDTEVGKIATLLSETEKEDTPLQKELMDIGKRITLVILGISAVVFGVLIFKDQPVVESFLTAVALSVAAIPEGLPAIVAVVLSLGVLTLARKKTIVRTLKAVETLGAVKYLLTDKTGTLTWNKINVVRAVTSKKNEYQVQGEGYQTKGAWVNNQGKTVVKGSEELNMLIETAVICNGAELEHHEDGEIGVIGDTTEGALLVAAERYGKSYQKIREQYEVVDEEPFSSDTKRMLVLARHLESDRYFLFAKGAPEVILGLSVGQNKKYFEDKVREWAENGWRNLAFAYHEIPKDKIKKYKSYLDKLAFLGLVGQEDAVRKEAAEAVREARAAGIQSIMITGDHALAAFSIGRQIGIAENREQVIDGSKLDAISDDILLQNILRENNPVRVFSRVSPEQKLRIVNLVKDRTKSVVAVTGDGANDAPSIKSANVGVAMGKSGSDVTKEVADVVLADDNYATLITGIFQGRVIFDNLIKFIRYLLSCNIGEIVVVFFGTLLGQLHILLPIQILFINLVTDSLPALALGFEEGHKSIMKRPPRDPSERILSLHRWKRIAIEGAAIGLITLAAYYYFLPSGFEYARTVAFMVLVVTQLLQSINNRSETETFFEIGIFGNRLLLGAIILSFILTVAASQVGFLEVIFKTVPIWDPMHWVIIAVFSSLIMVLSGLRKKLNLW